VCHFASQYILPVTTFAYCYGHIFYTIRHQNKTITGHVGRNSQDVRTATTSRDPEPAGQLQQQAKLSRTEMNVLQTTILIMIVFIVCWTPASCTVILETLTVGTVTVAIYDLA